jgi:hypothetical protein
VREEFARTIASATNLFAATVLPFQRMLLPPVLQLFDDSNKMVREAAMFCLEVRHSNVKGNLVECTYSFHLSHFINSFIVCDEVAQSKCSSPILPCDTAGFYYRFPQSEIVCSTSDDLS